MSKTSYLLLTALNRKLFSLMPSIMISKVVRNKEYCLIYEKPISEHGLMRMDFLMLLPKNVRIVLEIDGKQHYSVEVNPHGTSQYCSRCGAKGERFSYRGGTRLIAKWGKLFFCPSCRYEANADFNASANVHHSFFHELHWQPRIMRSG